MARDLQGVERILNRTPRKYDHRDLLMRDFITPAMRQAVLTVDVKDWSVMRILDQGNTPECTGYCLATFGLADPIPDNWDNSMGHNIYVAAKKIDGDNQDGSTSLSAIKAFMQFGKLKGDGYAWAGSIADIAAWVTSQGPCPTGIDWYYNMMNPDSAGFLHPSGGIAGGHEILISGVNNALEYFTFTNSWGAGWGNNGQAKIKFSDYQRLFDAQGDCCTALEVSAVPVPDPIPVPDPNAPGCWAQLVKQLFG